MSVKAGDFEVEPREAHIAVQAFDVSDDVVGQGPRRELRIALKAPSTTR